MKRFVLSCLLLASACSAPESSTPKLAREAADPSAPAPTTQTTPADEHEVPLADRVRNWEKTVYKLDVDGLPAMGPAAAPLTLVLFTDYECRPYCRDVETQINQLRADHGSDVRVVLAPRPLPFHKNAKPAALAALAAAEQGKLDEMHKALFAQDTVDEASIVKAAKEAGLDMARFETDRKGAKVAGELAKSEELAKRFSVNGTPSMFVNGRRITGSAQGVVRAIGEEELENGRELVRTGTPRVKVYDQLVGGGQMSAGPDPAVTAGPAPLAP